MTDPDTTRRLRPKVEALIRGMNFMPHLAGQRKSNIRAIHFDGPMLSQMVDVFVRLNPTDPRYPQYINK